MIRTAREKYLLTALCLLLGVVAFYRIGLGVVWPGYLGLRERLTAEGQALALARREAERLPELKDRAARAQARLRGLRGPLEAAGQEGGLGYLLKLLPAGVQLRELVPEAEEDQAYYRVSSLSLAVVGPFPQVQAFLGKLEAAPAYVRELDMGPAEDGSRVEVRLTLDLFFRPVENNATGEGLEFAPRNPFMPASKTGLPETPAEGLAEAPGEQAAVASKGRAEGGATAGRVSKTPGQRETESPQEVYAWPRDEVPGGRTYTFPVKR